MYIVHISVPWIGWATWSDFWPHQGAKKVIQGVQSQYVILLDPLSQSSLCLTFLNDHLKIDTACTDISLVISTSTQAFKPYSAYRTKCASFVDCYVARFTCISLLDVPKGPLHRKEAKVRLITPPWRLYKDVTNHPLRGYVDP